MREELLPLVPLAVLASGCSMRPWTPAVSVAYESEDTPDAVVTAVPSPIEGISRWQLPPDSPWSHYVKLTLLTSLDGTRPVLDLPAVRQLDVVQKAELAAGRLAASGLPSDTLWIVDLRGAASVAFGATLSHLARDPVAAIPTFNNWPAEDELVPAEETLAAMVTMWPKQPPSQQITAHPVFLLDAWRLAYRFDAPDDEVVDNRYLLNASDLPSADVLRANGITKIVYVVENLDDTDVEEDDVHEAAMSWQAAGVGLFLVDLDWLAERGAFPRWEERLPEERLVVAPRTIIVSDPAFYARARGGFGGVHSGPSPFHGGGTAFVAGGGHGGGLAPPRSRCVRGRRGLRRREERSISIRARRPRSFARLGFRGTNLAIPRPRAVWSRCTFATFERMLRRHASLAVLSAVVLAAGCGGTQIGYGPSQESFDDAEQPVTMVHEPCETSSPGAISIDVDHDGKPEAVRVMDHEREVCRAIHVDGDGKPDAFVYFDPSGGIRRQEADTNGDGRIDSVTSFKNGAATANATDADKNGNADTWELYKDGKVTRRMRDANGNGKVDEWWTWLGKNNGCADVHRDRDGDGKPDLKTEVCQAAAAASAPPR